ncbi:MAG: flagellar biosynthetic protein FliR [Deltaproteobacteria bacterium]|nr:flagellar biosynthetic protein FliR [Deltaproteobacteria bacterium]
MDLWDWVLRLLDGPIGAALVGLGLLSVRWLVLLSVVPIPALEDIGVLLRSALAVTLAVGALPAALPVPTSVLDLEVVVALAAKEALVGLALGAIVAFLLSAFDAAGRFTDLFRGATMSEVFTGLSEGSNSPLGAFFLVAVLALLSVSGGLMILLGALMRSAEVFPVAELPARLSAPGDFVGAALGLFGRSFEIGLLLAAPAMAVALLLDVSLGIAARVSPGFEGYFLAMPLRAALALGAMVVSLALLRPHLGSLLRGAVRLLAG